MAPIRLGENNERKGTVHIAGRVDILGMGGAVTWLEHVVARHVILSHQRYVLSATSSLTTLST